MRSSVGSDASAGIGLAATVALPASGLAADPTRIDVYRPAG